MFSGKAALITMTVNNSLAHRLPIMGQERWRESLVGFPYLSNTLSGKSIYLPLICVSIISLPSIINILSIYQLTIPVPNYIYAFIIYVSTYHIYLHLFIQLSIHPTIIY